MIANHIAVPFKGHNVKTWFLLGRLYKGAFLGERLKKRKALGRPKHYKMKSSARRRR